MLILFALILGWIISLLGWSELILRLLARFGGPSPERFDIVQPFLALPFLISLTIVLNLFMPIHAEVAAIVLGIGIGIFVTRLSKYSGLIRQPVWLAAGALWLFAVTTAAPAHAINGDSGFYHIPTIRWIAMAIQPLGVANFFTRLGYNSTWFPLSALFAQVSSPDTGIFVALATETLVSLFGIAVLYALHDLIHNGIARLESLFLMICALAGVTAIFVENISSASTDLPVLILALILVYVALRAVTNPTAYGYNLWVMWVLALFIISIKVSSSPIVLMPLLMLVLGLRANWIPRPEWRGLGIVTVGTAAILVVPWIVRGILTSGCFLFPLAQSCIWSLPWAVTPRAAFLEALWIASWARTPREQPAVVLANWNWLGPWFVRTVLSQNFLIPFGAFLLGVVLLALTRGRRRAFPVGVVVIVLSVMLVGGIYWFLTAPDLRFGVSWFWVTGLLVLTLGVWSALDFPKFAQAVRVAMIALFIAMCIAVAVEWISFAQKSNISFARMLRTTAPQSGARVELKETIIGNKLNVASAIVCWWTPACTPYFDPHVVYVRIPGPRLLFLHFP